MFNQRYYFYAEEFKKLLTFLKIKRQKNERPIHRLRHTFATNIYYLGVNDKRRQYLLGHSSIKMTNDTYTDFDPSVKDADVKGIYSNLYPTY